MHNIVFYKTSSNRDLIAEFIKSLDENDQNKIRTGIRILGEYGFSLLKTKWIKKIHRLPNIYELRITGKHQIRLLFIQYKTNLFLITHGFTKKTQKIPKQELNIAIKRAKEFV